MRRFRNVSSKDGLCLSAFNSQLFGVDPGGGPSSARLNNSGRPIFGEYKMQFHSLCQRIGVDTTFKNAPEGLLNKKDLAHLILIVLCLCNSGLSQLYGQEYAPQDVLKKIKLANEEGRSINAVSLDCKWFDKHSYAFPKIKIERLGSKVSFTGDSYLFDPKTKDHVNEASLQRYEKAKKLLGDSRESWIIYDGTRVASYEPARYLLRISTDDRETQSNVILQFDPAKWDYPGFPFKSVLRSWDCVAQQETNYGDGIILKKQYVGEINKIHTFTGRLSGPFAGQPLGLRNFQISFDENQGWHWIKFVNEEEEGNRTIAEREWKFKDGHWYPARSSIGFDKPQISFEIDDIKFGPENIASSFTWNESELPLGIRIVEGPAGSKNPERFSGGKEGERQYRLVKRANLLKEMNEKKEGSK
jgi:hypothetical protein